MSTFVLVHGGFHGGWSWEFVAPLLTRAGHDVRAPDLPGHGADATAQSEITYDMALDRIVRIVDESSEPVILVGHSMSGLIISQVGERRPEKVKMLVWVAAFLVPSGYSLKTYLDANAHLGQSLVLPNTTPAPDGSHVTFNLGKAREVFYNTTPAALAERAIERLRPVAIPYLITPVALTDERFGRIPRSYLVCLQDRCIPPAMQRKMIADRPCQRVVEVDTDHSPFECAPDRLAAHLLSMAELV